jgi:hypothetical protein
MLVVYDVHYNCGRAQTSGQIGVVEKGKKNHIAGKGSLAITLQGYMEIRSSECA